MNKNAAIYVAGHRGLVGGAILRRLAAGGYTNIIVRSHDELDLTNQQAVESFFSTEKLEYVFLCAAKVGGILANSTYPADFIYVNTMIGFNVVKASFQHGVKKLLNMGSSCIYPRLAPQPLKEEYLLTGPLEQTNDAYAIAKIAVIKLCEAYNRQHGTNFLSVMPTNLYGPGDNYDLSGSHVLPALIRKFHEAKVCGTDVVELWGDGSPYREFLYSDDLADAVVYLMEHKNASDLGECVNIGTGMDITIRELADTIRSVVYTDAPGRICELRWDSSKPNGTPKKLLDVTKLHDMGWRHETQLLEGIKLSYGDYIEHLATKKL